MITESPTPRHRFVISARLVGRMRLPLRTAAAIAAAVIAVPTAAFACAGGPGAAGDAFTTKTPYQPQGNPRSYAAAPKGFAPVFTENVSRHGTRTMSDSEDGDALYALWQRAQQQGALTHRGRQLGADIETILAANAADGYGLLTSVGRNEMTTIAERTVARLPHLLDGRHGDVAVNAESSQRTVDSANDFVAGLKDASPRLAPVVGATTTSDANEALLYFHKAKSNADYTAYTKSDQVAAVEALFALDQNVPDLGREVHLDFSSYITAEQAAWFGYLDDVTSFYENGPAFAGSDITYKIAEPLLDDLFGQLDAKRAGTSTLAADLRFTHAEEIFPLEALLGLKGASEQLPAGTLYTYADSPFRGARVAPMAANIQWDLFSNGRQYLVRMLVNEKQTAFKAACKPVKKGSYFYDLDELESCYGHAG